MADRNLTDKDIAALSAALGKVIGKGGGSAPATSTAARGGAGGVDLNIFDLAKEKFGKAAEAGAAAYDKVSKEITDSMGTWRDFTKSGVAFGNDVVGMSVAAKGARVDLGEFAQTVKENQVNLAGFGGGVGAGAKAFADLSKKMFDAGESTDSLRQLGYTNKELNDVLALQAGMIGSSMRKGAEKDELAIKAATSLAYEMDTMAKLTGKSREAQMESQKKLAADAAFNAKLDQATRNMSEKEAAEYRSKIMAEYTKAEAIGLGQSFKETFTYGQVMSKNAANEQAIAGKAGVESARAAQAAAANNFEEASRRMSNAQDEAIKNNKNANFQQLTIYGSFSGAAGEAAQKQYMANKAMTDTIKALEKEPENRGKSEAELKKLAIEKIKAEQDTAAGSTKAALNLQQRMNDVSSVMANSLVKPLNDQVNPALTKFADTILGARSALVKGGPEKGVARAAEDEIAAGRAQAQPGGSDRPKGLLQGVGYTAEKGGEYANKIGETAVDAANKVANRTIQRQGGSLEMGGKLFEDWGKGTLVELHGLEGVVRPEDMKKILSSSMGGISEAMKGAQQTSMKMPEMKMLDLKMPEIKMPEMKMPDLKMPDLKMPEMASGGGIGGSINNPLGGLNISELSKNVSTTFSSVFGGASKTIQLPQEDLAELTKPFTDSFTGFNSKLKLTAKETTNQISNESFDEFAGLDEAIAKQLPFDEFGDNFNEVIAKMATDISDAVPIDITKDLAQAKIDQARKDHDEAKAEVEKLLNDDGASDEELNSAYEKYKEKYDNLNKVVEESITDLAGGFDEFSSGWDDSIEKISTDISDALPIDEFGGLDEAIEEQKRIQKNTSGMDIVAEDGTVAQGAKINPETGETYYTDKISNDINTELPFDEFAGLDEAIAKQQQMNMPFDEFAGVDEAIAKQSSMQELISSTAPTTAQGGQGPIDINSFTLGPNGLPIPKPKSTKTAVPDKPAAKQASPGKAINPETGEEYTPVGSETTAGATPNATGSNSTAKPATVDGGKSTLDDVVKALSALNSKVGQLIQTSEQGYATIARSARSSSNNLYERAKA